MQYNVEFVGYDFNIMTMVIRDKYTNSQHNFIFSLIENVFTVDIDGKTVKRGNWYGSVDLFFKIIRTSMESDDETIHKYLKWM